MQKQPKDLDGEAVVVLSNTLVSGDRLGGTLLLPVPGAGRSPPLGGHPHLEGRIQNRRSLANLLEPVYTKDRRQGSALPPVDVDAS